MGYALRKQKKDTGMGYTVDDIIQASRKGDVERVEKILSVEPSLVNAQEEKTDMAPLHFAAFQANFKLVDALFKIDEINPRPFNLNKQTPLDLAHMMLNEDFIVYMRQKCLPPEFSSSIPKAPKP